MTHSPATPPLSQACAFRDSYEKFKKAGAEVIGISADDPSSHKVRSPSPFPFLVVLSDRPPD